MERGNSIEYVPSAEGLYFVEWIYNKKVMLASTCFCSSSEVSMKIWSKAQSQFVNVQFQSSSKSEIVPDNHFQFSLFFICKFMFTYVRDAKNN